LRACLFAMTGALLMLAGAANAQATRTWVSGVGDDANPCSRTAPCKTFAGAISKTAPAGEIDVLDPGGFGGVTITKAITIASEGAGEGGVLVSGTNGIVISAGTSDVVILRGLQIDGLGTGLNGVNFLAGAGLQIENCVIKHFTGYGVAISNSTSNATVLIANTTITENGAGTTGGVIVQPTNGFSASATLDDDRLIGNLFGARADATLTTGTAALEIRGSDLSGNTFAGAAAVNFAGGSSTAGTASTHISDSTIANNGIGLNANGSNSTLRIGGSIVANNAQSNTVSHGATLTSMGNNQIYDNAAGPAITVTPAN
jgi:hypothetical protein